MTTDKIRKALERADHYLDNKGCTASFHVRKSIADALASLDAAPPQPQSDGMHTPLPWRIAEATQKKSAEIVGANGSTVAKLTALDLPNAQLILRAVNELADQNERKPAPQIPCPLCDNTMPTEREKCQECEEFGAVVELPCIKEGAPKKSVSQLVDETLVAGNGTCPRVEGWDAAPPQDERKPYHIPAAVLALPDKWERQAKAWTSSGTDIAYVEAASMMNDAKELRAALQAAQPAPTVPPTQPEQDELRRAVRDMTVMLECGEWAEHVSSDPDASALEHAITALVGKANSGTRPHWIQCHLCMQPFNRAEAPEGHKCEAAQQDTQPKEQP